MALLFIGILMIIIIGLTLLDRMHEKMNDRLYKIERDMYYEQAERDGCEYPPQFRGH